MDLVDNVFVFGVDDVLQDGFEEIDWTLFIEDNEVFLLCASHSQEDLQHIGAVSLEDFVMQE